MTQDKPTSRYSSKIVTSTPSNTNSASQVTIEPSELALSEWQEMGLDLPDWSVIREYRLERVRHWLRRFDYAGIVLYDPLNIRYATDTSNMQVWCLNNAARYCFVPTEGPVVLFEFLDSEHVSQHSPNVDEIRPTTTWIYFMSGPRLGERAKKWAGEIADLVKQYGGGNNRLAIDTCDPEGIEGLKAQGINIFNGMEVMELARMIKHDDEVKAMRCSVAAIEKSMHIMQSHLKAGISEMRLWSYLHAENIARGGEWILTRLLNSGERTNPWYNECSNRTIQDGELVAFDTDTIGCYGLFADISRTWLCGDVKPTSAQCEIYQMAYDQVQYNKDLLKAGRTFDELSAKSKHYSKQEFNCNTVLYHGSGVSDEYPAIFFPERWQQFGHEGVLEENMILCIESYISRKGSGEGVKLEDMVVVTRDGFEPLSFYPYEQTLLG